MTVLRKRIICMMLLITMAFVIPANAASTRAISVEPDINFDGTRATCSVLIFGDRTTDEIVATMELRQGGRHIDDWSASGYGILKISETATVARNTTYTLEIEYSVNGDSKTPVSISRTNR